MRVINSFLFLSLFFLLSCKNNHSKLKDDSEIRERYFNLENNGWKSWSHTQKVKEINYTATEIPLAYYILKDRGTDNLFVVDSIAKANKRERVVEFEFLHEEEKDIFKNGSAKMDYESAIKYLSFNINKDFYLVTNKHDTISNAGVLFERTFQVAPSNKILLFFSGVEPNEDIQLVYDDKLFGHGILKFNFNKKITKISL